MYVARDESGLLCAYSNKPSKNKKVWIENPEDKGIDVDSICVMPEHWFPEVKWEDEEPRELVLKPVDNDKK